MDLGRTRVFSQQPAKVTEPSPDKISNCLLLLEALAIYLNVSLSELGLRRFPSTPFPINAIRIIRDCTRSNATAQVWSGTNFSYDSTLALNLRVDTETGS